MSNLLLVTSPKYDDYTEYLSAYALLVIKETKNLGMDIRDLDEDRANKINFESFAGKSNTKIIFLNGHGNEDSVCGHKDKIIVSNENVGLLKDKITYARACSASTVLGKKAVENNKGSFIGYSRPFSFWINGNWSAKPLNDKGAGYCLYPSNEVVFFLMKGKTSAEAHQRSLRMMEENMKMLFRMNQRNEPGTIGILETLWNNYDGQVLLGNEEAKIG